MCTNPLQDMDSVLILSMVMFLLSGPLIVNGQGSVYLFGDNVTLPCLSATSSENEQFTWIDQTKAVTIYFVSDSDEKRKTFAGRTKDKYDNFDIDNNYPNNVSLLINLLEVNDAGIYSCNFIRQATPEPIHVDVEAMPISVSISCARSSSTDCASTYSLTSDPFNCTCIAFGAYPNSLQFDWSSGDVAGVEQPPINNTERPGSFDYYTNAEIVPTENPGSVTCTLNGYSENWEGVNHAVYDFNPPICKLKSRCIAKGTMVSLTCTCTNASPDEGLVYSFYRNDDLLSSGDTNVFEAAIDYDQEYIFGCRGCNGVNYGSESNDTEPVICQRIFNYEALIASCIAEAIIIVVSILVIIYLIARDRLGYGKKREPRYEYSIPNAPFRGSTNQRDEIKGDDNRGYMDLRELEVNKNKEDKNLKVPEKNVKLVSLLPGRGMLRYHRALVMRAAVNLEAVVRTLSGDSTLRMNKVQSSEIQHILKLPGDESIVKVLGWCDTVPNYLICEPLSRGNLSDHLTEEFSAKKVHLYDNTKQKRFQVAEKGNAENLPKYALQVARGLTFLTKHRFLSPGLRSKKVLLDHAGRCKLYDFVSMENATEWIGLFWNKNVPFQWMPPEFLFLETISSAGDVWSFGVLIWEMFSYGSEPYQGQTRADVEKSLRANRLLPKPDNCPGAIWQLMKSCWEPDAEKRTNIYDVTSELTAMCHEDREYLEILS
ncbi:uncharacterized protein [Apostichopus japonicus]|uniref:uncharacterized protein isoform X3 n=1 Tax=Stichopus japonicus TaxID=307972 RepID=UPI003AB5F7E6